MEMHQGSVLPPLSFALVVAVVTEFVRDGWLSELQHHNNNGYF